MQIGDFLTHATQQLTDSGIITARLDTIILLEDALSTNRAHILAHPETVLPHQTVELLEQQITRRCSHEPLAYIRGHVAFYGRDFIVTPDVLVPRPETEGIIDFLKELALPRPNVTIADVGTGSGCIGVTAALELTESSVDLLDISSAALEVAAQNAERLDVTTDIVLSDLLANTPRTYDIILTNLPYVPDDYPINRAAGLEPSLALFSGSDGLVHYRAFWKQLSELSERPLYVITEAFPSQHNALAGIAGTAGYTMQKVSGYVQLFARV